MSPLHMKCQPACKGICCNTVRTFTSLQWPLLHRSCHCTHHNCTHRACKDLCQSEKPLSGLSASWDPPDHLRFVLREAWCVSCLKTESSCAATPSQHSERALWAVSGFWSLHRQPGPVWEAHVLLCVGRANLLPDGGYRGLDGGALGGCERTSHSLQAPCHSSQVPSHIPKLSLCAFQDVQQCLHMTVFGPAGQRKLHLALDLSAYWPVNVRNQAWSG